MAKSQKSVVSVEELLETSKFVPILRGTSPLLTHNPQSMTVPKDEIKRKKIPSPEVEAKAGLYLLEDHPGEFFFPLVGIRNCALRAAGIHRMKFGKLAASTVLSAALLPTTEYVPILDADTMKPIKKYTIDTRRVVIKGNGVMRSRPRFDNWAIIAPFEIDESVGSNIAEGALHVLAIAGKIVGIGDFRPNPSKGLFGKFMVSLKE
jgi:hypothetical protein